MTAYSHPYEEIKERLSKSEPFHLTKKSWDGYSNGHFARHLFAILECGPQWIKLEHVYNSSRQTNTLERNPFWITWTDFGSFAIEEADT